MAHRRRKIVGTIQARMNSQRYPGKVLTEVNGMPMLWWQIQRLRFCKTIDQLVVATTSNPADEQLVDFCQSVGVDVFVGEEDNVLNRVAEALVHSEASIHVEFFGDSPLVAPELVDSIIAKFLYYCRDKKTELLWVTNAFTRTFPAGMEVSVYHAAALHVVNELIDINDKLREHAGFNLSRHPDLVRRIDVRAPQMFCYPNIHLEVDVPVDLPLIDAIIESLHAKVGIDFSLEDILSWCKKNEHVVQKNMDVSRRWENLY